MRKGNEMNFSEAYRKLNRTQTIDEIINREVRNGFYCEIVKYHIIDAIKSYIAFTKSSMFAGMTYLAQNTECLLTPDDRLHRRVVNAVWKGLAQLEHCDNVVHNKRLIYMLSNLQQIEEPIEEEKP